MSALTDHQFCFLLPGEPYLLNVTVDSLFYGFVLFITKTLSGKKHLSGFWDSVYGGGGCSRGGKYLFNIYLFIYLSTIRLFNIRQFCKISSYFSSKRDFEHKNTDIHVHVVASDTGQVLNH